MENVRYVNGNIDNLCGGCPMRSLELPEDFERAASQLDDKISFEAEYGQQRIGKATHEIGVVVNACRRLRRSEECELPEVPTDDVEELDGDVLRIMAGGPKESMSAEAGEYRPEYWRPVL